MGKQLRKGQVAMEFVFMVGVAFTIMLVFISSTRSEFDDLRSEEERSMAKDVSMAVQHELIMASTVEDGYYRTFETPLSLEGTYYWMEIENGILATTSEEYEYVLNVPLVTGNISKGVNTINKTNGVIYLN